MIVIETYTVLGPGSVHFLYGGKETEVLDVAKSLWESGRYVALYLEWVALYLEWAATPSTGTVDGVWYWRDE